MTVPNPVQIPISGGQLQNPYQEFVLTIAAGQRVPIAYDHMYFRVMAQTNGTLRVRFENGGQDTSVIGTGIGIEHVSPRRMVEVINGHATDTMTITIALSMGVIDDSRLSLNSTVTITGSVNANLSSATTTAADVSCPATTTTQVVAANTSRKELWLGNPQANGTTFRFGDVNTGAARGTEMSIGEHDFLTTTAAQYVYNPTGAAIVASVTETT